MTTLTSRSRTLTTPLSFSLLIILTIFAMLSGNPVRGPTVRLRSVSWGKYSVLSALSVFCRIIADACLSKERETSNGCTAGRRSDDGRCTTACRARRMSW